jgi:hypothetical protein
VPPHNRMKRYTRAIRGVEQISPRDRDSLAERNRFELSGDFTDSPSVRKEAKIPLSDDCMLRANRAMCGGTRRRSGSREKLDFAE